MHLSITDAASLPPEEVQKQLGSSPAGLTNEEAAARLAELGPNAVRTHRANGWAVLGRQFAQPHPDPADHHGRAVPVPGRRHELDRDRRDPAGQRGLGLHQRIPRRTGRRGPALPRHPPRRRAPRRNHAGCGRHRPGAGRRRAFGHRRHHPGRHPAAEHQEPALRRKHPDRGIAAGRQGSSPGARRMRRWATWHRASSWAPSSSPAAAPAWWWPRAAAPSSAGSRWAWANGSRKPNSSSG